MYKKIVSFLLVLIVVLVSICLFALRERESPFTKSNCPFCNSSVLARQSFYEDELAIALCDYRPIMPGHCLVVPKRHVERFEELSDEEADRICRVMKKVHQAAKKAFSASAYLLLEKNGHEVGQEVPHVHFHYIPRQAGDSSILKLFFRIIWNNLKKPLSPSQTELTLDKMKEAMEEVKEGKDSNNPHLLPIDKVLEN